MNGADTFDDWHTYEIDWQPDQLQWIIDGDVKRTLKKADTYNETSKQYQYPQTPSRLQMSLWPAGQSSNAEGTIAWAGGEIDWDSEDIQQKGYYYTTIGQVDVQCYSGSLDGVTSNGKNSYVYTNTRALQSDVEVTNNSTVLGSMGATGLDMSEGANSTSATSTSSSSDSVPSNSNGGSGNAGSNSTTTTGSGSGTSSESGSPSTTSSSTSQTSSSAANPDRVLSGSLFAVLVAVGGLVTL